MSTGPLVTVTMPASEWTSLLSALSRCGCGELAEIEFGGRVACAGCALPAIRGRCRPLEHIVAAMAIADALSPHLPVGTWEREADPCSSP